MPVVQGMSGYRSRIRGHASRYEATCILQALELVSNRHELAALLGAGRAQMDNWLADASEIPESYFLKAIELCLDRSQESGTPLAPPH